jgi:transposase-like protein
MKNRKFSEEFKKEAVKLVVEQGGPVDSYSILTPKEAVPPTYISNNINS